MESEINQLRSLQNKLGDAIGIAVDALLQDESDDRSAETLQRIRERKREALESLAHARDILKGNAKELDEERLYGEDEYRRRRKLVTTRQFSPPPRIPEPAAASRPPTEHRRQQSSPSLQSQATHPLVSLPRTPPVQLTVKSDIGSGTRMPVTAQSRDSRRVSITKSPVAETPNPSDPMQAPWNYTKSSFGIPTLNTPGMPRPPPPSQPTLKAPPNRQKNASSDPLGAISP